MKVTEHIKQAKGKTLFSFEIVPPQKGQNIQELYNNIAQVYPDKTRPYGMANWATPVLS